MIPSQSLLYVFCIEYNARASIWSYTQSNTVDNNNNNICTFCLPRLALLCLPALAIWLGLWVKIVCARTNECDCDSSECATLCVCLLAGLIRSVLGCTAAFTLLAILAYATDNALALWVCMPHERCARRIYTQNREAMGNGKRHKHTQYKILCVRAERWGWEIYTRCMAMGIFNGSVYIPFGSGLYARVFTFSRSSYNVGRLRSVLCAEHTAHKMYSCFEHTAFRCRDVV